MIYIKWWLTSRLWEDRVEGGVNPGESLRWGLSVGVRGCWGWLGSLQPGTQDTGEWGDTLALDGGDASPRVGPPQAGTETRSGPHQAPPFHRPHPHGPRRHLCGVRSPSHPVLSAAVVPVEGGACGGGRQAGQCRVMDIHVCWVTQTWPTPPAALIHLHRSLCGPHMPTHTYRQALPCVLGFQFIFFNKYFIKYVQYYHSQLLYPAGIFMFSNL